MDRRSFSTALWFSPVDFDELAERNGRPAIGAVAFHIAMFEVNPGVSFGPVSLQIAEPWAALLTAEVLELLQTVVRRVWAQWRYEHGWPCLRGPKCVYVWICYQAWLPVEPAAARSAPAMGPEWQSGGSAVSR